MAKTWENFACVFYTQNTLNNYGDSKYTVTKDKMTRHAPVNKDRAPDQVNTGSPAIAYLDPKSNLYKAIKAQRDDRKIMIEDVVGDTIRMKVIGVSAVAGADHADYGSDRGHYAVRGVFGGRSEGGAARRRRAAEDRRVRPKEAQASRESLPLRATRMPCRAAQS